MDELPTLLKYKNYYEGKHAILQKKYKDESKVCNHVVTNFCKIITDTYSGYVAGKSISYVSNDDIEDIQSVINYNDDDSENMQWLTNALIYGVGYELQWLDKQSQIRYSQINPLNGFPVYSNTLDSELVAFVRWYDIDTFDERDLKHIEVYTNNSVITYKVESLIGELQFIREESHYFKDVPVSVFTLNEHGENIFGSIINLNDAYNDLQSSLLDDYNAFVDAYLVFTGGDISAEDAAELQRGKEKRTLNLPEGVTASFLTKGASTIEVSDMSDNIKKNIFKVTACPDMADENFLAQSGTALAYKLVGFENVASGIVARFTKAIQRRIELICNILNLKASDAVWRDINISFVRNLPVNLTETIQLVTALKGTVSDKTLLSQIPWIDDIDAELEAVKKQKEEQASLYTFDMGINDEEDDEE